VLELTARIKNKVFRFDVSMDDLVIVHVLQSQEDAGHKES
jgi:hypothetical protein